MKNTLKLLSFILILSSLFSCSIFKDKELEKKIIGSWKEDNGKAEQFHFSAFTYTFSSDKTFNVKFFGGNEVNGTYKINDGTLYLFKNEFGVETPYGKDKIMFNSDGDLIKNSGGTVYRLVKIN
jgi:hypothetical protein